MRRLHTLLLDVSHLFLCLLFVLSSFGYFVNNIAQKNLSHGMTLAIFFFACSFVWTHPEVSNSSAQQQLHANMNNAKTIILYCVVLASVCHAAPCGTFLDSHTQLVRPHIMRDRQR